MDDKVAEAAAAIQTAVPNHRPGIGAVLGSGLGELVNELEDPVRLEYKRIPHFPVSSVSGHKGELVIGVLAGVSVCFLSGRAHCYEGHAMDRVVFPVRVLGALGVKTLIVSNAAGAINAKLAPGDIVIIDDHINLLGDNPLRGSDGFVDLSQAFDGKLKDLARRAAGELGLAGHTGVYSAVSGPSYETPAEIVALRILGADLVGMSTVPEVIMANRLGMRVLGLSLVTNMAAGISENTLSHAEVIETADRASATFKTLVRKIIAMCLHSPLR